MTTPSQAEILERIASALEAARTIFSRYTPGEIAAEYKSGHDPVTEADRAVDAALRRELLRPDEGWLSEESVDDFTRLEKRRVWVVDPLDGTREFVAGIPEFCVSVAMVDDACPVAGGICNPATNEVFLGSLDSGLTYNGKPAQASRRKSLEGAVILASRSETRRGEWRQFEHAAFQVKQTGSVAYKLALVAAGLADATFTLTPKHEWDVAGGAVLVESGGGFVSLLNGDRLRCNNRSPKITGLLAGGPFLREPLQAALSGYLPAAARH
ncbi:MAG TPA: 3'(2'),5'-bisphosphate nucleotidase CysQ [Terriglobales bacterium]|nr:3'(2'),5'-bisphosphate nucleotidase CysQ [Terriglobales bacterium]